MSPHPPRHTHTLLNSPLAVRGVWRRHLRCRNGAALSPEMGVFAPPSHFFENVKCVGETEMLVEQQPPQGVLVCDHAGLVINQFSYARRGAGTFPRTQPRKSCSTRMRAIHGGYCGESSKLWSTFTRLGASDLPTSSSRSTPLPNTTSRSSRGTRAVHSTRKDLAPLALSCRRPRASEPSHPTLAAGT